MNIGIGISSQNPDEGVMKGNLSEVACGVWFTSKGGILPKMIKYEDEEGMLRCIGGIHVVSREKKYYCGIEVQEYRCSTVFDDKEYLFRLYYYVETSCWKVNWEKG